MNHRFSAGAVTFVMTLLLAGQAGTTAAAKLEWIRQLGTDGNDYSFGISSDGLEKVFISGEPLGSLGGPNTGNREAVLAKFVDSVPCDFNGDGLVDIADYTVWRNGLGMTHTVPHYAEWRASLVAMTSDASVDTTVAEPAAFAALLACGPLTLCSHRWRFSPRACAAAIAVRCAGVVTLPPVAGATLESVIARDSSERGLGGDQCIGTSLLRRFLPDRYFSLQLATHHITPKEAGSHAHKS